jgi:glutamate racemase
MILGVFDSGLGGLTVLAEVRRRFGGLEVLYFADTARLPYGGRSPEQIRHFVREILAWFRLQGVGRVLMACNTSSALALDALQPECDLAMDGLIRPAARVAARSGRRIGVIATEATARSRAYRCAIHALAPDVSVWEVACPQFVPIVEGGHVGEPLTRQIVRLTIAPLLEARIDVLVYGCTHYPFLAPVLDEFLPRGVVRINPAMAVAEELRVHLPPDVARGSEAACRFCVSGDPEAFTRRAEGLLGFRPAVEGVRLPPTACAALQPLIAAE